MYAVYKPKKNVDSEFVQIYFELDSRMNSYMHPLVNKGAKNDMKVSDANALKGSVVFPKIEEQIAIAQYFNSLDHLITLHQRILRKIVEKQAFVWEQRKLPEFVSFFNGLTYTPDDVEETGTLVLRSSNVKNGEIVDADNVYVNDKVVTSENVHEGDIIVVVRNGSRVLIGKHAQIKASMPNTVIGAFMSGMRSEHSSFVNALLDTSAFENEIAKNMGATINQITGYMFSKMEFMIPSGDEQQKIGEYFQSLDHLITLHHRKHVKIQKDVINDWEQRKLGSLLEETRNKTTVEDEDTLLSCAIDGMYLNSELFSHFRGSSNIGYLKIRKNDLILSAQNLHLGNCNVNLRFEHGIISPAYKVYELVGCNPLFMQAWVKKDSTKDFFLKASTEGASVCRKNIVWGELYKQELPIPNIEEQTKVGEYFNSLDHLITLHHRKHVKIQKDVINDWEQRKLKTVATFSKGSGYSKGDLQEDGTPIILYGRLYTKYETIISEVDTFVSEKSGSVHSQGGEVIIPASGETAEDIARASTVENKGVLLGGDLNIVIPNEDIDSAFLALSISNGAAHRELASKAQGKSVVHIHNAEIQALNIAFPSKPEQSRISVYFSNLDHLITLHQHKQKYLKKH